MVGGLRYFGRMLDKIRLLARGELNSDYHANLGHPKAADGRICNFLRVDYERVRQRVLEGGSWAAGREIAFESRPDGAPPLNVVSDGTVF